MKKSTVFPLAIAVAGTGIAAACAPQTPPTPDPVPALGCYTGTSGLATLADVKIVGSAGDAAGLEVYDEGSDCSTNVDVAPAAIPFVEAADATEAEALCTAIDPAMNSFDDLAAFDTPAPGLSGYFACSTK